MPAGADANCAVPLSATSATACPNDTCPGLPPATITAPGTHHVIAKACDVAGNCTTAVVEVNVRALSTDVTPPETYNVFDVATRSNVVYARDDFPGMASTPLKPVFTATKWTKDDDSDDDDHSWDGRDAELRVYSARDAAGNGNILTEKVQASGNEVHVDVIAFAYTTGCPAGFALPGIGSCRFTPGVVPPGTTKKFEWATNRNGSLKSLEQNMTIGRGANRVHVMASFDARKNETTIVADAKSSTRTTVAGLVLLRLATRTGGVSIEYTNPATNQVVVFAP
jgi:hypothetical protein